MDILILVTLIVLNGLFAMAEIALITARRSRLARLADGGDGGARVAMRLGEEPNRFLSTIQIGITSIGILSGIFGQAALAEPLALWLQGFGFEPRNSELGATALVVVVVTYVSIVIGEIVPKRIGQLNPERIAILVARPMTMLAALSRPFVFLLSISTRLVLKLLGQDDRPAPCVTEEEIHAMLDEGSEAGVIEKSEHNMVRNVFRLDDRLIGTLMVPRADIVTLDVMLPLEDNLQHIADSCHARFPVCRGNLDEILGTISAKTLFKQMLGGGTADLTAQLEPAVFVPESLTGMALLEQFRASRTHMVFVVDEYGEVQGIVTLQDVLEAVTGEFQSEEPDEAWAVQRADGSWLLDGLIPVPELKDRLELRATPEEGKGRFHTLSGMIMWLMGSLPRTGDIVEWENWRLEVVDLDGKRIDKVLASLKPEPVAASPAVADDEGGARPGE